VIERFGEWGQRWANTGVGPSDLDPGLLMWDMRRRIHLDLLPDRRVFVQVDFRGARRESWWLVLEFAEVSVCRDDPGFECDLLVTVDTLSLHRVWIGRLAMADALHQDLIRIDGPPKLARAFPKWFALSSFAGIRAAGAGIRAGVAVRC
jgi:hypothetical protein